MTLNNCLGKIRGESGIRPSQYDNCQNCNQDFSTKDSTVSLGYPSGGGCEQ